MSEPVMENAMSTARRIAASGEQVLPVLWYWVAEDPSVRMVGVMDFDGTPEPLAALGRLMAEREPHMITAALFICEVIHRRLEMPAGLTREEAKARALETPGGDAIDVAMQRRGQPIVHMMQPFERQPDGTMVWGELEEYEGGESWVLTAFWEGVNAA
jgi:hypothetical protein